MSEKYLEGFGDPIEVGQVRMDVKGSIAVVISISTESILIQVTDLGIQIVPMNMSDSFCETTFSLGML